MNIRDDRKPEGERISTMLLHSTVMPMGEDPVPPKGAANQELDGYRRIQIISQPSDLLDPLFPGLKLIEDFILFADLLHDYPYRLGSLVPEILDVRCEAKQFLIAKDTRTPAFSSVAQMIEIREALTEETKTLRQRINDLLQALCEDPATSTLVDFMASSALTPIFLRPKSLTRKGKSILRAPATTLAYWD